MKRRELKFVPEARADMADAWQLIYVNDGQQRADQVYAVLEAFCRSLVVESRVTVVRVGYVGKRRWRSGG